MYTASVTTLLNKHPRRIDGTSQVAQATGKPLHKDP